MCRSGTVERRKRHDGGPMRAFLGQEGRGLGLRWKVYLIHRLLKASDKGCAGIANGNVIDLK